jgi:hypothetical protein
MAVDLKDAPCVLLHAPAHADPLVPTDEALMEMAALAVLSNDPLAWTDALVDALGPRVDDACRRERLAAVQMHASIGRATGARLLSALWMHPDPGQLAALAAVDPGLAALAALLAARGDRPLDLPPLAAGALRLLSVADQLSGVGLREERLDLLGAAAIVQRHHDGGRVVLAVAPSLEAVLRHLLANPRSYSPGFAGNLDGVLLEPGFLVIDLDDGGRIFAHGFPVVTEEEIDGAAPAAAGKPDRDDLDRVAIRKHVLDNIMSTSVLLEFLRDPKISSIPGLVAEVVNRTRNPQVLEVIINNRSLHTGFANKAVPLACLRSPVNVPLKSLRRFIHVKYVSKVDLKRLANDRTGIRREVGQEITRYLESLN